MVNVSPYTTTGRSWRYERLKTPKKIKPKVSKSLSKKIATRERLLAGKIKAREKKLKLSEKLAISRSKKDKVLKVKHVSTGRLTKKKSSWIKSFSYDTLEKKLYMTTKKGKTYDWSDITKEMASMVIRGDASCITDDKLKKRRWWIGKSPSLGAAYWHILVQNYGRSI